MNQEVMSDSTAKRNEFTFIWNIENFQLCAKKNGVYLLSPVVTADTLDGSEWYIQFYPRGNAADSKGYVSLFLYRAKTCKESQNEINIYFKLELIDEDGKILNYLVVKNHAFKKYSGFGSKKFIAANLINNNNKTLTISCHMVKSNAIVMPISGCSVKSKIEVDQSSLEWIVKNFESPSMTENRSFSDENCGIQITLTAPEDDIKINILKLDIEESLYLTIKISLLDSEEIEQLSRIMVNIFEFHDNVEFPTFIKKSHLNANQNKYLKDNAFKLKCDFSFSNNKVVEEIEYYPYDSLSVLQNDFWNMYTSKKGTDITLKAQNDVFHAHKSVLTARSSVFSAMFDTEMLESHTGIVDIPDIDAKILKSFLQFIYTGAVGELDEQTSQKLMVVADKYQVFSLKEICAFFLMSSLTVKNVCDILLLSDLMNHGKLKTSAVEYMNVHVDEVLSSKEWSQCIKSNIKLATEVLCKLSLELTSKRKASTGTT